MHGTLVHRLLLLLAATVSLFAGTLILPRTTRLRDRHRLVSRPGDEGAPPEYVLTSALLGGFRGLFLTVLWTRGQTLKNEGRFYEMVQTYNIITKLEPNYANAWAFAAWDLAFNVSVEFKENVEERVFWVFRGVDLLRKQAIPRNPHVPELYYELAWIFHFKVGQDTDYAHPLYRQHLAMEMHDVLLGPGEPELLRLIVSLPRDRETFETEPAVVMAREALAEAGVDLVDDAYRLLLAPPEAAAPLLERPEVMEQVRRAVAWTAGHRLRTEFNMEPATMLELAERYGAIDWRLAHAHSLYWASLAYRMWKHGRPEKLTLKYERLVYFSLIKLVDRGRLVITPDGRVFGVPDYRFFDAVVKHMDEMVAYYSTHTGKNGKKVVMIGALSGYENFLRSAVFQAYFDGREAQARRLLAKLREVSGNKKYDVTLAEYVENEFDEWIQSPNKDRSLRMLDAFLRRSYWYLALGDRKNYQHQASWAEYFHRRYVLRRWNLEKDLKPGDPDYRDHVPRDLDLLRVNILVRIFTGREPGWSPPMLQTLAARLRAGEPALWKKVEAELERFRQQMETRRRLRGPVAPAPDGGAAP